MMQSVDLMLSIIISIILLRSSSIGQIVTQYCIPDGGVCMMDSECCNDTQTLPTFPSTKSTTRMPNRTLPTVTVPNISIPTFPTITIPNVTAPTFIVPNLTTITKPTSHFPNFTMGNITPIATSPFTPLNLTFSAITSLATRNFTMGTIHTPTLANFTTPTRVTLKTSTFTTGKPPTFNTVTYPTMTAHITATVPTMNTTLKFCRRGFCVRYIANISSTQILPESSVTMVRNITNITGYDIGNSKNTIILCGSNKNQFWHYFELAIIESCLILTSIATF